MLADDYGWAWVGGGGSSVLSERAFLRGLLAWQASQASMNDGNEMEERTAVERARARCDLLYIL